MAIGGGEGILEGMCGETELGIPTCKTRPSNTTTKNRQRPKIGKKIHGKELTKRYHLHLREGLKERNAITQVGEGCWGRRYVLEDANKLDEGCVSGLIITHFGELLGYRTSMLLRCADVKPMIAASK